MKIHRIQLSFSNAYLITDKKSILVDAGAPNEADQILTAVQKAGIHLKDISLLLQTHGHFDHAGSAAALKRQLNIPIAVHVKDAFMLKQGLNGEIKPRNFEAKVIKVIVPNSFEPSEPDILLEEEITLNDFGVDAKLIFTPGHTKGSLTVISANTEAIVGDVMMGGWMGGALFGSWPNYHYFIDDLNQVHASIKKIMSFKPTTLYVGHGGPLAYADVLERFSAII